MIKTIIYITLFSSLAGLLGCANNSEEVSKSKTSNQSELTYEVDKIKRDSLVEKYDLRNFSNLTHPVFLTLDEFFDGNNDDASIAPNLSTKLKVKDYYTTLKDIQKDKKVIGAYVELKEVLVYDNNQLNDNEWFYTDIIYFVGDITKEEIALKVGKLLPDEVEYSDDERIFGLNDDYQNKNIVYVWWD
jgi:hypothetical protein